MRLRQHLHEWTIATRGRGFTVNIPNAGGRLALGTWQDIYLWERRSAPHQRRLRLHLLGE